MSQSANYLRDHPVALRLTFPPNDMARKKKEILDLATICASIEACRRGSGFDAFAIEDVLSLLMSGYDLSPDLVDAEKHRVFFQGMSAAAANGVVTPDSLRAALRKQEAELLSQRPKAFVLAANLSFYLFRNITPKVFLTDVSLTRYLPQSFLKGREAEADRIPEEDRIVRDYTGALIRVRARSPAHAFDLAIDRLDLLRGIWNFALNRGTWRASTSDPTRPVNSIRLSRVVTLHHPSGTLATSTYRFYPEFRFEQFPSLGDDKWQVMVRGVRSVQRRLAKIPYRESVERALIYYGRALDAIDMETAFLKLWSVLELLSGLGGENYDRLLQRVRFLYTPDPMTTMMLEHLRYQRNEATHLGFPQSEMRTIVYQLKEYVERFMRFHLMHGRFFANLDEAGLFLDLPQSTDVLERRAGLLEKALRFRGVKRTNRKKRT